MAATDNILQQNIPAILAGRGLRAHTDVDNYHYIYNSLVKFLKYS